MIGYDSRSGRDRSRLSHIQAANSKPNIPHMRGITVATRIFRQRSARTFPDLIVHAPPYQL